jgi:FkbM family methyltransferase
LSRSPGPADRRRARLIQRYGIDTVIDIGANTGQYATLLRDCGYTGRIQSYEPLPSAFAQLRSCAASDPLWTPINQAVGEKAETVKMHVAANSVSSSILSVAELHRQAAPDSGSIAEIMVQSTTLDSILVPLAGNSVMVKADTQGLELPILKRAGNLLGNVGLVEIEMSLVELYQGQALFREVDGFLLARGFELKSIEEGFFDAATGQLLQIDAVYGNTSRGLHADLPRIPRVSGSDAL